MSHGRLRGRIPMKRLWAWAFAVVYVSLAAVVLKVLVPMLAECYGETNR